MANQIVNVNIVADTKKFSDSMKKAGNDTDFLTDSLKNIGKVAAVAFAAASAAAVAFGVSALKAAAESEAISRGMENAVKNAGEFGDSSKDIARATKALDDHSTKLGELIGVDDELFNTIKTGWLAVPSLAALGTKGINKLAEVTADVAAGTGKDLQSIATAFIKVAGDQETALSKLTRQGIVLTNEQKKVYQSLLDTNDEAAAQAYLIEQLGIKYQGAAAAAANPFERLKVIFENLQETIGKALLPAFEDLVPQFQAFVDNLVSAPEFQQFMEDISVTLSDWMKNLPTVVSNLQSFGKDAMPAINAFFPMLNEALQLMADIFLDIANTDPSTNTRSFAGAMQDLAKAFKDVGKGIQDINNFWNSLPPFLKMNFFEVLGTFAQGAIPGQGQNAFNKLFGTGATFTNRPKLAEGGIVMPRPGGVPVTVAEAGQAEAIIPLDKLGSMGGGVKVTVNGNVGWSPEDMANIILKKQRQALALAGLNGIVGVR